MVDYALMLCPSNTLEAQFCSVVILERNKENLHVHKSTLPNPQNKELNNNSAVYIKCKQTSIQQDTSANKHGEDNATNIDEQKQSKQIH